MTLGENIITIIASGLIAGIIIDFGLKKYIIRYTNMFNRYLAKRKKRG